MSSESIVFQNDFFCDKLQLPIAVFKRQDNLATFS